MNILSNLGSYHPSLGSSYSPNYMFQSQIVNFNANHPKQENTNSLNTQITKYLAAVVKEKPPVENIYNNTFDVSYTLIGDKIYFSLYVDFSVAALNMDVAIVPFIKENNSIFDFNKTVGILYVYLDKKYLKQKKIVLHIRNGLTNNVYNTYVYGVNLKTFLPNVHK